MKSLHLVLIGFLVVGCDVSKIEDAFEMIDEMPEGMQTLTNCVKIEETVKQCYEQDQDHLITGVFDPPRIFCVDRNITASFLFPEETTEPSTNTSSSLP